MRELWLKGEITSEQYEPFRTWLEKYPMFEDLEKAAKLASCRPK